MLIIFQDDLIVGNLFVYHALPNYFLKNVGKLCEKCIAFLNIKSFSECLSNIIVSTTNSCHHKSIDLPPFK